MFQNDSTHVFIGIDIERAWQVVLALMYKVPPYVSKNKKVTSPSPSESYCARHAPQSATVEDSVDGADGADGADGEDADGADE